MASYKEMMAALEKAQANPERAKELVEDVSEAPPQPKHLRWTGMPQLKRVWASPSKKPKKGRA